jgi:two-component system sensor histidine kinase/response regulator
MSILICLLALLVASLACYRAWSDRLIYQKELNQLKLSLQQAEKLLKLKASLAKEVAHEIKNPISAILCSVETMDHLIGKQLPEEHRISLGYIREYGKHLLSLVSDFLDISMSEEGILKNRPEVVNVRANTEAILGLVSSMAQKNNISIKLECSNNELKTSIDPKHFKQILFNIVHNAIRYTAKNGKIIVSINQDFPRPNINIAVSDNGCGIKEEAIPYLFDVYARYQTNNVNTMKGLGLGLPLCKNLLDLANGEISIQSQLDIGTTVTVKVPIYVEKEEKKDASLELSRELEPSKEEDDSGSSAKNISEQVIH